MSETYVILSSLKHYDGKVKKVIAEKQDQLVGTEDQIVSFDTDGKVISKNFDEIGEKSGQFLTRAEYERLVSNGLVEQNKNYYILGIPMEDEIMNLQAQIDELKARLDKL